MTRLSEAMSRLLLVLCIIAGISIVVQGVVLSNFRQKVRVLTDQLADCEAMSAQRETAFDAFKRQFNTRIQKVETEQKTHALLHGKQQSLPHLEQ